MLLESIIEKYGNNFSDIYFIYNKKAKIKLNGELKNLTLPFINGDKPFRIDNSPKSVVNYLFINYLKKMVDLDNLLKKTTEFDVSIYIPKYKISFRTNIFRSQGGWSAVLRLIPNEIPKFETLGLPLYLREIADFRSGLVLVTGVTGSGKSTTLAALIEEINKKHFKHIITIEDPIEFRFQDKESLITQRELGIDVPNFALALKSALRQAPDVIMVGEMRDKETIEAALKAAETGHLVFSTLHTYNAVQSIERILSYFEGSEQQQVRFSFSNVLRVVISQKLIRGRDKKLHLAYEVLYNSLSVKNNIKENKLNQVFIAAKNDPVYKSKNVLLNESLYQLVKRGYITKDMAIQYSYKPDELQNMFSQKVGKNV